MKDHSDDSPEAPPPTAASLSPDIALAVQREVQRQVDRELGRSAKIIVAGLLFFGIASFVDVRGKLSMMVKAEVDALVGREDPETSVRHNLNDLVNRAIVSSYLIGLRRADLKTINRPQATEGERTERESRLSIAEWARLIKWVQDEKLDDQDFSDVLGILGAQEEARAGKDANDFLAEMLDPPTLSRFRWMLAQPGKRLAILQNFKQPELGAAALNVALADRNSKELRLAAMDYIRSSHLANAFDPLFLLASTNDPDIRLRALLVCAWLDPLRAEVAKAVEGVVRGPSSDKEIETALKLAAAIWYAPSPANERAPKQIRTSIQQEQFKDAARLLDFAFAHGAYVEVLSGDTLALMVRSAYRSYDAVVTSRDKFSRLQPYWTLLQSAAARGDLRKLQQLAPRSCSRGGLNALLVKLKGSARITIANSWTRDGTQVSELALARSTDSEQRRAEVLTARATDRTGQEVQGQLTGVGGGSFEFFLPAEFNSESCLPER